MSFDAFVLAAGLGTRLRPLTEHRPKPLVPVCGVPMLSYALALCARHGKRRVVVNAHHLAEQLVAWRGRHEGCDVEVVVEAPDALGTGGGLKAVASKLSNPVVVVNGDTLTDLDLGALAAAVPAGGAALALRPDPEGARRHGVVAADAEGVVVRLSSVARADGVGEVDEGTFFTGLHALDPAVLARVPDGPACIVRSAYKELLPLRRLRGLRHDGLWLDVGDPVAYLAANLAVLTTMVPVPLDPWSRAAWARGPRGDVGRVPTGVVVSGSVWVGAGARISAGVVLSDSVVGARARVPEGVSLTRCVVWDGVEVPPGVWRDSVFHDGGWMPVGAG